jgi:hypothetical protein
VHPRLRKIEVGFGVAFVAGELMADGVVSVTKCGGAGLWRTGHSRQRPNLLAKWMIIMTGGDVAVAVGVYSRATEVVGG